MRALVFEKAGTIRTEPLRLENVDTGGKNTRT